MIKNTLVFLFVILISISGFSQDCKYKDYFYWCGLATLDHNDGNYERASKRFKIGLKKVEFPLGVDLDFALKTAFKTNDSIMAKDISIQLAKGGIPLEYFDIVESQSWFKEFESNYSNYQQSYKEQFDVRIKEKFFDVINLDSSWNETYHRGRRGELDLTLEDLISFSYEILNSFKDLISEYGYPCEQNMGYYYKDGYIQPYPTFTLFIHIFQRGELFYKDRMSAIVCDGKMRPGEKKMLEGFKGYGDSSGIEQEMKIRYDRLQKNDK